MLLPKAHHSVRHRLRRVRRSRGVLEVQMRAHSGRHLRHLRVLYLLGPACVNQLATVLELLHPLLDLLLQL